ncbi:MAG: hypothetical protein K0S53_2852 [Bacteroidetes bacterium]|nr:hypothetical protein [Bacteroidota bacterium]
MKGLYIYCNGCKTAYSNETKIKCNCKEYVYKAKIHVPGTKRDCRTKILDATNYNDAIKQRIAFEEQLIAANFIKKEKVVKVVQAKPVRLVDCMDAYMAFINDVDVPSHEIKDISSKRKSDMVRFFARLNTAIERNNISVSNMKFESLNSSIVGFLDSYLKDVLGYRNKTYNNVMTSLNTFYLYISRNFYPNCKSPFYGVKLRTKTNVISININEFLRLLPFVTPENSIRTLDDGNRKNLYRPWMKNAFLIALFAGGRNEEITKLKWNGIVLDEEDEMAYIEIPDFKTSRIKSRIRSDEDYKMKKIVITKEFSDLLFSMGYNENKGKDEFIIAPHETLSREGIKVLISQAFTHFLKISGNQTGKTLKHLRKTYSTAAAKMYGDQAHLITGHEGMDVMKKHYIDEDSILKDARKNFSVLGNLTTPKSDKIKDNDSTT